MAGSSAIKEPTMEELLASIKKIISGDENNRNTDNSDKKITNKNFNNAFSESDQVEEIKASHTQIYTDDELESSPKHKSYKPATLKDLPSPFTTKSQSSYENNFFKKNNKELISTPPASDHLDPLKDNSKSSLPPVSNSVNEFLVEKEKTTAPVIKLQTAQETVSNPLKPVQNLDKTQNFREKGITQESLISSAVNMSIAQAFERLQASRSLNEDLNQSVESILRPMLRDWLNDNLPSLVERLIRTEIQHISRGKNQ